MSIKKATILIFISMSAATCGLAQVKWNIKAGLSYSNIRYQNEDGKHVNTSSVPGIYAGLGAGITLAGNFSLQPSLIYAKRGFKQLGSSGPGWGKDFEAKVSYFELPIDLLYSIKAGPGNLLLAAGPYIGYGTGGKWHTDGPVAIGDIMINDNGDIKFQNDASHGDYGTFVYARPWDYGVHVKIGYSLFNQYTLSLDLQQGVADLQPRWADYKPKSEIRNQSVGIAVGYSF